MKRTKSKRIKGMTLVEMLVSLVILTFVVGAVYTILNLQTIRATQVQRTSVMQTDAQVALTLLKWDLASAGLAFPKVDTAIGAINGGPNAPDGISIKAVGLGIEACRVKWSWLLDKANSPTVLVRAWSDSLYNFAVNETVVVLDKDRNILNPPGDLAILAVAPDTFHDPQGNPIPAQRLTLNNPLSAIAGLVVIRKFSSIYSPGLTIRAVNNKLVRGSDTLLDNVEDLQFAYGIDSDGDNVIDTYSNIAPQFATLGRKWAIRYTLVVTSRPMSGYTYHGDSISIEDHTYALSPVQKKMRRAILTGIISPQNLQP